MDTGRYESVGRLNRRRLLGLGALGGAATLLAACNGEVKEVIKEVPVEVIKEVQVAGETKIVEVPGETKIVEVPGETKIVEVPGETKIVEVPGETVEKIVEVEVRREIIPISFWDFETRPLGVAAQDAWFARAGTVAGVQMNREVVPFSQTATKILAAKATDTLPDMLWSQPDSTWSWAAQEIVAPAEDAWDLIGIENFGENDRQATVVDGISYGIPQFLWPHILYYRSDLYAENNLPAPDSWDTIVSNARALHDPTDFYGYYIYLKDAHPKLAWSLMPAHDAYVFDENGNNAINSPGTIAALELAKTLDDLSPPGSIGREEGEGRTDFIRGVTAHVVSSTSFSGTFLADKPEMLEQISAVAQPSVAGTGAGLAGMNIMNITTGTAHYDRMVEFFGALFERDNYQEWFQSTVVGWAPTHKLVQESDEYWDHPRIAPVKHIIRAGVSASKLAWVGGSKYGSQGSGLLGTVTARNIVKDMFIKVIQGESPQAAAEWAEQEVQKVIDENE